MKKILLPIRNTDSLAGLLLILAGIIAFMGIITGEIYYPNSYSTRDNQISDLGATEPPNSIITQPSATIFNTTMILTGIIILVATWFLHQVYKKLIIFIPITLLGTGILGVGIFPGNIIPWHPVFAIITFISGSIAAILSYKITPSPLRYLYIILGVTAFIFLILNNILIPYLGAGGTERWIAYPILLWIVSLGSYLSASPKKNLQK